MNAALTLRDTATWQEIGQQPAIWRDWADPLQQAATEIAAWITARGIEEVWLSGAGTSAFIGDILTAEAPATPRLVALATTDFVSAPRAWLGRPGRILAIQFGRSGDSSESIGMLDLLDAHRPDIDRLNITCNSQGTLAIRPGTGPGESRVLSLPEATHDAGFAMTSSFTTMLVSALACLGQINAATSLPKLADAAQGLLGSPLLARLPRPDRAIYLGTGALKGAAREAALKVLELTAGKTMTMWDSALGFRHGPKSAMQPGTQVYVLLHPDPESRRYDTDIATELRAQFPAAQVVTIGPGGDLGYEMSGPAALAAPLAVLPAQVLAARWSAELGLVVDDPFQGHGLSRVVSGVTLYPVS